MDVAEAGFIGTVDAGAKDWTCIISGLVFVSCSATGKGSGRLEGALSYGKSLECQNKIKVRIEIILQHNWVQKCERIQEIVLFVTIISN